MKPVVHAGLLLTGGASKRMGRDKASIVIGGATLAERSGAVLRAVAEPTLAIGPEAGTGMGSVADPKQGPLVAFHAGSAALAAHGFEGPVFVLACDMPFVTAEVLIAIAAARHGADAAVPIVDGRLQPLCAVYAPRARGIAARCVRDGRRSMQDLLAAIKVEVVPAESLGGPRLFADVDTPEDLERYAEILEAPA